MVIILIIIYFPKKGAKYATAFRSARVTDSLALSNQTQVTPLEYFYYDDHFEEDRTS